MPDRTLRGLRQEPEGETGGVAGSYREFLQNLIPLPVPACLDNYLSSFVEKNI